MSSVFSNPWDNSHNPITAIQRYRRRKAKRAAAASAAAPSTDHRDQEVEDNRTYASKTSRNAQAQQSYFDVMTGPFADFFTGTAAPTSKKWKPSPKDASGMPKPSPNYNPFDW